MMRIHITITNVRMGWYFTPSYGWWLGLPEYTDYNDYTWDYRLYMGLLLTVMYTIIKAKLSIFYGINFVKTDNGITIYIMGLVAATTALS